MIRATLLAIVMVAASLTLAQDAEDELVIIPRSEVRLIIAELNRLRAEVAKMKNLMLSCTS